MRYLYGAILGDLAGMPFEKQFNLHVNDLEIYPKDCVVTDDTIMTLATASVLLSNNFTTYTEEYKIWGKKYFSDYYGKSFKEWIKSDDDGYMVESYGNGCLMRMSPIPYFYRGGFESKLEAFKSTSTSHTHFESKKAVDILNSIYGMILYGYGKDEIKDWIDENYPLPEEIKPFEKIDATAQGTLPFVLQIFLSTESTHEAILEAISYGGDTDTNASIVGELSNAYYDDISQADVDFVESKLDEHQLKMLRLFNKEMNWAVI